MVERLREAVAKAREQRERGAVAHADRSERAGASGVADARGAWSATPTIDIPPERLKLHRVVSVDRVDRAYVPIDVLRTRVLAQCAAHGWRRVAVTSPSAGCGKSTIALHLAFSMARQPDMRVALLDFDMRRPSLARMLGVERTRWPMPEALRQDGTLDAVLRRVGDNLAFGLNTSVIRDSAELLRSRRLVGALETMTAALQPDVVLFDLPPLFASDDAVGFLPHADAALVVTAAGETRAREVDEMERTLAGVVPVIGIVLNKCDEPLGDPYTEKYYG